MYPFSLSRRRAILYVRFTDGDREALSVETQIDALRDYCESKKINAVDVCVFRGSEEASVNRIRELLKESSGRTDAILALRFHRYTSNLKDLADLCMQAKNLYHIELYSVEHDKPLWNYLMIRGETYHPNITICNDTTDGNL